MLSGLIRLSNLLFVKIDIVMLEIPSSERVGINLNDTVLDKGLSSDELVVGGIIDDI